MNLQKPMTSHEALEIVKQACAALQCDWMARVKIHDAVSRIESDLAELAGLRAEQKAEAVGSATPFAK